jgi:hypothetical protein
MQTHARRILDRFSNRWGAAALMRQEPFPLSAIPKGETKREKSRGGAPAAAPPSLALPELTSGFTWRRRASWTLP